MAQRDFTMRSWGDRYRSLLSHFVSLGRLRRQGMLHPEFESEGRPPIT